jgi:hypothetical protein
MIFAKMLIAQGLLTQTGPCHLRQPMPYFGLAHGFYLLYSTGNSSALPPRAWPKNLIFRCF